ncbi:hypothetical protein FKM82_015055 [Ascaphus truei]
MTSDPEIQCLIKLLKLTQIIRLAVFLEFGISFLTYCVTPSATSYITNLHTLSKKESKVLGCAEAIRRRVKMLSQHSCRTAHT